jgi:hypothetical protein
MGCSPHTKIFIDIRMGTRFAGEYIFLVHRKKDRLQVVHLCLLFQIMGRKKKPDSEKSTKPGVSLDAECRDILSKIRQYEYETERTDMAQAQAIRKCIRLAWDLHYSAKLNQGKVQSGVGAVIEPGSETLDSGHSTATKKNSRKAG